MKRLVLCYTIVNQGISWRFLDGFYPCGRMGKLQGGSTGKAGFLEHVYLQATLHGGFIIISLES
jgi:hypothetical protein